MRKPHIFASNPLDRGERERRDEGWISDRAKDSSSKFLPMRDLNVLLTDESQPSLGWIDIDELRQLGVDAEPVFLGLLDGTAHFVAGLERGRSGPGSR